MSVHLYGHRSGHRSLVLPPGYQGVAGIRPLQGCGAAGWLLDIEGPLRTETEKNIMCTGRRVARDVAGAWGPRRKDSRENSGAVAPSSPHCEPRLPQPVATRGHVAMRGPPPAALPATACALRQCESRPNLPVRHSRQRPRVAGTASRRAGSRHVRGGVCTRPATYFGTWEGHL